MAGLEHAPTVRKPSGGRGHATAVPATLVLILALNAVFFGLLVLQASTSSEPVRTRIVAAFASGDLIEEDFPLRDWRRGANQYNDCMVLQMLVNDRRPAFERAVAPITYVADQDYADVCASLRAVASGRADTSTMLKDRYSRYWHGYLPVSRALLSLGEVSDVRNVLRIWVVAALLVLALAGWMVSGTLRMFAWSVAGTGLLFWNLPGYAPGLSFAPADGFVMIMIAGLILFTRRSAPDRWVPISAAFGAGVAYLDFLTGPLPVAACLLFVCSYLAGWKGPGDTARGPNLLVPFVALAAFAVGALLTVVIKQAIVILVLGPDALTMLLTNLKLYSGQGDVGTGLLATYRAPFREMYQARGSLTFHQPALASLLFVASAASWFVALFGAVKRGQSRRRIDLFVHAIGAFGIVAWILILPTHSAIHAEFMVRILIVPIALGWSAAYCAWASTSASAATVAASRSRSSGDRTVRR